MVAVTADSSSERSDDNNSDDVDDNDNNDNNDNSGSRASRSAWQCRPWLRWDTAGSASGDADVRVRWPKCAYSGLGPRSLS